MSDSEDDARTALSSRAPGGGGMAADIRNQLREMPPQTKLMGGVGCCLLMILMLLTSLKGLHATKFAISRNSWTGVVHFDPVYYGGRNLLGFWNHYIEFPATVQSIEWLHGNPSAGARDLSPFTVRTLDGLMVNLGIVVKYHLKQDQIPHIYRLYKEDIEEFFISNMRSELQEVISGYPATHLYEDRVSVEQALKASCDKVCRQVVHGFLSCWYINMLDVELDGLIEAMNVREQVEKQKQRTEKMKRNASLIRTTMEVISSDFDRQKTVVEAEAQAAAYNITTEAQSDAQATLNRAGGDSLGAVQEAMTAGGMALSNYQMLDYLEKLAIIEEPIGPMVYGDFPNGVGASMHVNHLEL